MNFQDTGCMSESYSEVLVRAFWGLLNYLCLPAALKYRCVHLYNPLMISIHAYKYAMESKPNTRVLRKHGQVAFPHSSSILEVHGIWVPVRLRRGIVYMYFAGENLKESGMWNARSFVNLCFISLHLKIYEESDLGCLRCVFQGLPPLITPLLAWKCNTNYDSYNLLFCLTCQWISGLSAEGNGVFS